MKSIEIENLTVSYMRHPAIHHFDMCFNQNEMWAIFGPNGAGKSTLLKAIMKLIKADTGVVNYKNLIRSEIAYLPQQSDIDRSQPMTVFELTSMGLWFEICYFGSISASQKNRVEKALERVEMIELSDQPISNLSNGQFQRVLFARMLVQNAQFILLDEPFNAVDARTTFALLELLKACNEEGKAIIAVLHDYEQVRAYFPNTLLVAREKIAAGKTHNVLIDNLLSQANETMIKLENETWCAI